MLVSKEMYAHSLAHRLLLGYSLSVLWEELCKYIDMSPTSGNFPVKTAPISHAETPQRAPRLRQHSNQTAPIPNPETPQRAPIERLHPRPTGRSPRLLLAARGLPLLLLLHLLHVDLRPVLIVALKRNLLELETRSVHRVVWQTRLTISRNAP